MIVVLYKTAPNCSQAFGIQLSSEKGLSSTDPGPLFPIGYWQDKPQMQQAYPGER